MNLINVVIIGIVQGITEFLPISSSGHLVVLQNLFGINEGQLTLDIFLHIGTVIPILIIYWQEVKDILLLKKEKRRLSYLIIVGIIPTGLMGFFLKDFFAGLFSSVLNVGFMLLITGLFLYLVEKFAVSRKGLADMKEHNAVIIGIAQGLAIIPGISRSGTTITASIFQGLDRESAAKYSFLVSIPVILGAGMLELKELLDNGFAGTNWALIITGAVVAAVTGYLAIKYLLHVLKKGSLIVFAYYCWILGVLIIILAGLF
ncbi:MAG: undecaprenyl-diphosphate phosphatase [Firmicutes bacterium]|nr:undecaprenyl-diphosphate phosphatase [Bacillota bacterium]